MSESLVNEEPLILTHGNRLLRDARTIILESYGSDPKLKDEVGKKFDNQCQTKYPQKIDKERVAGLVAREWIQSTISSAPYSFLNYVLLSEIYICLEYPDLAAGAAYKALLLSDAVRDESDEYHENALSSPQIGQEQDAELSLTDNVQSYIFFLLAYSLLQCGCLKSAMTYQIRSAQLQPNDGSITDLRNSIIKDLETRTASKLDPALDITVHDAQSWPDDGYARREQYPWNHYEPDRLEELSTLNEMMSKVAPKLEVKAVALPSLANGIDTVIQLGVFAKEDLAPSEAILTETSLLTANNKLQDALCDACSSDLPELEDAAAANTVSCEDCEVIFCSQDCHDQAMESYHPALCEKEVDAIAKDVPPAEAADSLYSLLLLRSLAMAEVQGVHPLELDEIKYIWADFTEIDPETHRPKNDESEDYPESLPFNFEYNIRLPFHMLEKMDIDIYSETASYDTWVFNTLYAKFRGTASARLSGLGGRAIRGPEVCAVHPMWCLANHSCDPNVEWNWGGSITFRVRTKRVQWRGGDGEVMEKNQPGIKKGEEILNHYCDLDLPVNERREWACGALGGDCLCERCLWESEHLK